MTRKTKATILITNDDGIYAEGIFALYQALKGLGNVIVAAPDNERSSIGHAITLAHPIWVKKVQRKSKFFGYGISGTPADCVKFAINIILKRKPDLIVSGINLGRNDGCSVFYSGTIAGAREGALIGIPSMAVSLGTFVQPDYRQAAVISRKLTEHIFRHGLPAGTFLNVNVPSGMKTRGIRMTRQGTVPIHGEFRKRTDPNLRDYYWLTGRLPRFRNDLTIDTYALDKGYVTVTPIHCDMTDENALKILKKWAIK